MKHNILISFCIAVAIKCLYLNSVIAVTTHSKYVKKTPSNKSISSNVLVNNNDNRQHIISDSTLEDSIMKEYMALKQSELNFKHTHRIAWYSIKGILFWFISIILVLFSGVVSGLTLGFMSVSEEYLCNYYKKASVVEKFFIYDILLIKRNHHKLLVTLLLCNSIALEALPIFLDRLMRSWIAVLLSVTVVLIFGEIVPQAVCSSKLRMQILTASIPIVKCLIKTFSFISHPIAKLLDCFVEPSTEKTTKSYPLTCHEMAILFSEYCRRDAWAPDTFKYTRLQIHIITLGFLLQRLEASCCSRTLKSTPTVKNTTKLNPSIRCRITNSNQIIPVYIGNSKSICGFVPKFIPHDTIQKVENINDLVVYETTTRSINCRLVDLIQAFNSNELVLLTKPNSDSFRSSSLISNCESSGNISAFVTPDFLFEYIFNPKYNSIPTINKDNFGEGSEAFKEYYLAEAYSFANVDDDMQTKILGYYYKPESLIGFKKIKAIIVEYFTKKRNLVSCKIIHVYKKIACLFSLEALRSWVSKKKNLKEPLINSVKEQLDKSEAYDVPPAT